MNGLLKKLLGQNTDPERVAPGSLPIEGEMPEFVGIESWINSSSPLTKADLQGKVVLVDFWTYSCVNCLRTLPHLMGWHQNYSQRGLVIVGVHSPEFEFEKERANVEAAVKRHGIEYPIALDNKMKTWQAYRNHYWPAHYFIDRRGKIRYHHFGEGGYRYSEQVIRLLLEEDGGSLPIWTDTDATDRLDVRDIGTPETYLGYTRLEYLGSPERVMMGEVGRYSIPERPAGNVFYLDGEWEIHEEYAVPRSGDAKLVYRYRAAEINLVMAAERETVVEILIDDRPLDESAKGTDVKFAAGKSVAAVKEARMYNLVNMRGKSGEHVLELRFPDPDIKCFSITFG